MTDWDQAGLAARHMDRVVLNEARTANDTLDDAFGGEDGVSPIRFGRDAERVAPQIRPYRAPAHSLADELPPPRPEPRKETPGEALRAFLTFAALMAALYAAALVVAGMAVTP